MGITSYSFTWYIDSSNALYCVFVHHETLGVIGPLGDLKPLTGSATCHVICENFCPLHATAKRTSKRKGDLTLLSFQVHTKCGLFRDSIATEDFSELLHIDLFEIDGAYFALSFPLD